MSAKSKTAAPASEPRVMTGVNSADKTHRVEVGELAIGDEVLTADVLAALVSLAVKNGLLK